MQIALITADTMAPDAATRRDGMPLFAGQSILQHQLQFVLRAGCEKVICLAEQESPDFDLMRRKCSQAGAGFRLLLRPRELSAVVAANDHLLILAKNVIVDQGLVPGSNGEQPFIVALRAETAIPLGFERIDATRAWAGVMMLPGGLVEELRQLPEDNDPVSSLLRVALIAGTPVVELPVTALTRQTIALPLDAACVRRMERERINRLGKPVGFAAPVRAFIERLTVRCAPYLLATPHSAASLVTAAAGALLLALTMGRAGYTGIALVAVMIASAAITAWQMLRRISGRASSPRRHWSELSVDLAADGTLAAVLAQTGAAKAVMPTTWFAPLVLLGIIGLARRRLPRRFAMAASDRALLAGVLLLAHGAGILAAAVMTVALVVLAALYVYETLRTEITTG